MFATLSFPSFGLCVPQDHVFVLTVGRSKHHKRSDADRFEKRLVRNVITDVVRILPLGENTLCEVSWPHNSGSTMFRCGTESRLWGERVEWTYTEGSKPADGSQREGILLAKVVIPGLQRSRRNCWGGPPILSSDGT